MCNNLIIKKSFISCKVRSINWSTITNFPGGRSSFNDPTAETETISVTPSCFKASIFALKFIFDGDMKCPLPCLGRKITLLLYLVFNISSEGFPQGVSILISSLSQISQHHKGHSHQLLLIYYLPYLKK